MLKEITPNQYEQLIDLKGTGLVVIGTESCKICSSMKPVFEAVAENTNVRIVKIDSDEYEEYIREELLIDTLPTFMIVKEGKVIGELKGEQTFENLIKLVNKIVE